MYGKRVKDNRQGKIIDIEYANYFTLLFMKRAKKGEIYFRQGL